MNDTATLAGFGTLPTDHNQPPLTDALKEDHADLVARRDELLDAFKRAPTEVADADTNGKMQDFMKQIDACAKRSEALRKDRKEPFLEGGRQVDGFFKSVTDPLAKAKKALGARVTDWLRRVEAEERRRREEEARRAQIEAKRAEQEALARMETADADAGEVDEAMDEAIVSAEMARKATDDAAANAAELSRQRGEYGSVGSLRTTWAFEVLDIHDVDLGTLRPHLAIAAVEQAIRSFVKAGGRDLKGVRIFEEKTAVVR